MYDKVVYTDYPYMIMESGRLFGGPGFNVYKLDKELSSDKDRYRKINNLYAWFTTLNAAKDWLDKYKEAN